MMKLASSMLSEEKRLSVRQIKISLRYSFRVIDLLQFQSRAIQMKKKKLNLTERDYLGLLERGHGLRVERGLRRGSWHRGRDVRGEGTHDGSDGSALNTAGGSDNGGLDRQRLLGQPRLEAILQFLELELNELNWVLIGKQFGHHHSLFTLLLLHFVSFPLRFPLFAVAPPLLLLLRATLWIEIIGEDRSFFFLSFLFPSFEFYFEGFFFKFFFF